MSGHSHWVRIKHKKVAADASRAKTYGKIVRMITIAAREGGDSPESNPKLRVAIEKAREVNMPHENIERAIKRGSGASGEAPLEKLLLDAYGPGGVPLLIEAVSDNRNRTLGAIRSILAEHGGKLSGEGTTRWMFRPSVVLEVSLDKSNREAALLQLMEAGIEEFRETKDGALLFMEPQKLSQVLAALKDIAHAAQTSMRYLYLSKQRFESGDVQIKQKIKKLIDALKEQEDINEVYTTAEIA